MTEDHEKELRILVYQIQQFTEELAESDKQGHAEACKIVNELLNWMKSKYRIAEMHEEHRWKVNSAKSSVEWQHKQVEEKFALVKRSREWAAEAERRRKERASGKESSKAQDSTPEQG